MDNQYPKLRLLEFKPLLYDGQPFIYVRDPLQLNDKTILVPQPLAPVLAFCDGTRDVASISRVIALRYGVQISANIIDGLVEVLDKAFLLENERFEQKQRQALEAFRQAPNRPSCGAGHSYPDKMDALTDFFDHAVESVSKPEPISNVRGVISPHIDYLRGNNVYARVWQAALPAVQEAEKIVIFGTDHSGNDIFTLTRQHYATPLGILPTDIDTVDALSRGLGEEAVFNGELRHACEHSIEFAVAWCQYIWLKGNPGKSDFPKLIPILTGDISNPERYEQEEQTISTFVEILRASLEGRRVLYVAAADLAHVGPAFDGPAVDTAASQALEEADREIIAIMCDGDAAGFLTAIQSVNNRNNICGVTPIYLTLRMLEPSRGEALDYMHCPADEAHTSLVSICGAILG